MNLIKSIVALTISVVPMFIAPVVSAADEAAWVYSASIKKLHVQPNANVYVTIDKTVPNLGCPIYNANILQLDTNAANFDQQYSMLLAATMGDKKVDIYVKLCGDSYAYAQNTNLLK